MPKGTVLDSRVRKSRTAKSRGVELLCRLVLSLTSGVAVGIVLACLTPHIAEQVADNLRRPSCSDPTGLVQLHPTAAGDFLKTETLSFPPENLVDGNTSTAWSENEPGLGLGSQVVFTFDKAVVDLRLMCVVNGYARSWDLYQQNPRVRSILLEGRSPQGVVTNTTAVLEDAGTQDHVAVFQDVHLLNGRYSTLTMTIESAYSWTRVDGKEHYEDTSLSEIEFWGLPD